jgi:hypothetical protein
LIAAVGQEPAAVGVNHDLHHQRWRYEEQGTAQSGLNWAPPEGGPQVGARPGGKDLLGKNHEAASASWTGRAIPPNPHEKGPLLIGATGRSPVQPAASYGTRAEPPGGGPARPMLFTQKLLAPGPQPKYPGIVKL